MPNFKKESVGDATVWTLRNNKGNELKVDERGARITSMRFCDKDYTNRFVFKDDAANAVKVDGGKDFADWERVLNSFEYASARYRILRNDFRGCQVGCPMNSVASPIEPVTKYNVDRNE